MAESGKLNTYQYGSEEKIYERLIFGNRIPILILLLLLTVFLSYQATLLRPDASFEKMIPVHHPYIQAMLEHLEELGAAGTTVQVAIEVVDGDIFSPEYMTVLKKISDEVFYLPGVDRNSLRSLWTPNVRWTEVTEEGFDGGVVIPQSYDGSKDSLEQLKKNILRSGEVGRLVANNFKSTIVEVNLYDRDPQTGEPLDYQLFSQTLEENVRNRYQSVKVKAHIVGFAKIVGDLIDGISAVFFFAVITFIITAILLFGAMRCFYGTIAPLVCSVIAVVWQLGALTVFGYGLNAYSILVPFLVFAIGVSHGVQVVNTTAIESAAGAGKELAARKAFRKLYVPGMTALLSDAIGFLTLFVIEIQVIQDLAVAASLGVAAIIFTNLVLLPIIMSYVGISKPGVRHTKEVQENTPKIWRSLAVFAEPQIARISVVLAACGFLIGFIGSQDLRIGDLDAGAPELHPDSRYNLDNRFITQNYSTSSDVLVVMVETPPETCSRYSNMDLIDRFTWTMQNVDGVESTISLVDVSKQVLMGFNEGNIKWQQLTRNQRALDSTFFAVPPQLMNTDCSLAPVAIFLKDHKAETLEGVTTVIEEFARKNNTESIKFRLGAGNAGVEAATNQVIGKAQGMMLWLVYGVVCILIFITFNSIATVACIVIPLFLTTVLCQALMAYLGIGIKVATLPVIALGVGVGVDYGIYIYGRLEMYLRQGMALPEAYFNTLKTTGKAVTLTGVSLAIGVGTWIFSPIKFQADMGKLLTFMFLWNMFGAIWLLPALAHFLIKPDKFKGNPAPAGQVVENDNASATATASGTGGAQAQLGDAEHSRIT